MTVVRWVFHMSKQINDSIYYLEQPVLTYLLHGAESFLRS